MVLQAVLIEAGIASLGKLTEALSEAVDFVVEAQKSANSLGYSFTAARQELGSSLDGLRGTIESKMTSGFKLLDAGFQGNVGGMAQLVQSLTLVDENTAGAIKNMARLESAMGLSRAETNELSLSLLDTGRQYKISAEKLVESLSDLNFKIANLAGYTGEFAEARKILEARFHGQNKEELDRVFRLLTDTSAEGLHERMLLGLQPLVEEFQRGDLTGEDMADKFIEAISKTTSVTGAFTDGGPIGVRKLGIMTESIGRTTDSVAVLAKRIEDGVLRERSEVTGFQGDDLGNVTAEYMNIAHAKIYDFTLGAETKSRTTTPLTPTTPKAKVITPTIPTSTTPKAQVNTNTSTVPTAAGLINEESSAAVRRTYTLGDESGKIVTWLGKLNETMEEVRDGVNDGNQKQGSLLDKEVTQ